MTLKNEKQTLTGNRRFKKLYFEKFQLAHAMFAYLGLAIVTEVR
jgi:hypothetical protein